MFGGWGHCWKNCYHRILSLSSLTPSPALPPSPSLPPPPPSLLLSGHLLFEMICGYELTTLSPSNADWENVKNESQIEVSVVHDMM